MTPATFRPDWLLSPPPRNPYLLKEEYTLAPNLIDKILYNIYLLSSPDDDELEKFIKREEGNDLKLSQKTVKSIQNEIKNSKLLESQNNLNNNSLSMNKSSLKKDLPDSKVLH